MSDTARAAEGRWHGILVHFGLDPNCLRNVHGPCPLCGGKDRFRFDDKGGRGTYFCSACGAGSGFDLLCKFKGWTFKEAANEVDQILGNVSARPVQTEYDPMPALKKMRRKLKPPCSEVIGYLAGRLLEPVSGIYSATHDYYEERKRIATYKCMVCPLLDKHGKLQTFHVTFLKGGTKAPVASQKKLLKPRGEIKGCAIRLGGIHRTIGVAEGIESALAATKITGVPCWATANTILMENFEPPEGVGKVIIFSDNDANYAGQKSAYALANKLYLAGYGVEVRTPTGVGNDFADQLVTINAR